ncbi:MAG: Nitroreductase [Parcubacteria group bacterium GW2011_GWA2_51_10]|nr:MAG: Nitroreductase [Parcubacteria group bacterium GW2011_GWA2_51_10]
MDIDLSRLFHQSSKNHLKGHPPIHKDSTQWPVEWKTIYYKSYPRLPKIPLSKKSGSADLFQCISQRRSKSVFSPEPISLDELGVLLQYSYGITSTSEQKKIPARAYPSGGGRFPLEVYPLVLKSAPGIPRGLYHYNVKTHELDVLLSDAPDSNELGSMFVYDWVPSAAIVFLMTAIFLRTQVKYGERGYRYILLEAGHAAQNVCLVAEALQLHCNALGGTVDRKLEELLDIDGRTESLLYALALGK